MRRGLSNPKSRGALETKIHKIEISININGKAMETKIKWRAMETKIERRALKTKIERREQ